MIKVAFWRVASVRAYDKKVDNSEAIISDKEVYFLVS